MNRGTGLVLLLLLLSGCLAATEGPAGSAPPQPTRTSSGFACVPGTTWRIAPDACAGLLGGPHAEVGEPAIATFGSERIAVAAIANITTPQDPLAGVLPSLPVQEGQRMPCRGFAVCLFTSDDGGTTWLNTSLPAPRQYYDPEILFTPAGRLVVATLAFDSGGATRIDVTSTADDGLTWSPTVTASTHDRVDRPWLRAGHDGLVLLYVADGGQEVRAASSKDDGVTWSPGGTIACRWPSPPIRVIDGDWMFLCTQTQNENFVTRAIAWDPATSTFETKGSMPWSRWFPILVLDGPDRLVAITSHEENGEASITTRRSLDQGSTWDTPSDLRKASPSLEALQYSCLMGAAAQSDGTVRVIVTGIEEKAQQAQLCLPRETRRFIWALDVDAATGALVATRRLGSPNEPPPMASSDLPPVNDDFHSVRTGAMAWSHDGVIAWTRWD